VTCVGHAGHQLAARARRAEADRCAHLQGWGGGRCGLEECISWSGWPQF
jgi:hypothetical protein